MRVSIINAWYKMNAVVTTQIIRLSTLDDKNPFDQLHGKMSVGKNVEQYKGTASSFYNLLTTIGVIGIITSIIVCGLSLVYSKNSSDRAELKRKAIFKTGIAVCIFAFPTFVGIYHDIVYKLSLN